jgi:hypothetical protein
MASAKIKNTTNFARTGIVTLGVPFTKADNILPTDTLVVDGAVAGNSNQLIQWYPQGARWDNNAVKYARASFRVELEAQEEKTVQIFRSNASSTPIPFNLTLNSLQALANTTVIFTVQGFTFVVPIQQSSLIEGGGPNDHYARYRYFTHLPAGANAYQRHIWVEFVTELFSGQNYAQFYFRFGFYRFEPTLTIAQGITPRIDFTSPVILNISGPLSEIRWKNQKMTNFYGQVNQADFTANYSWVLINPTGGDDGRFPMGASHCYKGVLLFENSSTTNAEYNNQILAMAEDWKYIYPITQVMPDNPPYITSEQQLLSRSTTLLNTLAAPTLARRGAYNWSGIVGEADSTITGTHGIRDYGYGMRGFPFLKSTNYNWIPFLEYSTRMQATRHNWFYDTQGNVITPAAFQSAGVKFWNGTYFRAGSDGEFRGYNRTVNGDSDCPRTTVEFKRVFGPDKEHYTNKMHILQGLITMDWYSLEYAKMYSKYWIYANRTDAYPGQQSAIHNWGTGRAAGRVSECAAWLYEFYADPELKQRIKTRLTYNLGQPGRQLLNKTLYPGGIEVLRVSALEGPSNQGGGLGSLNHWRPWEEAISASGWYLLAKALISEDPNDADGLRMLEIARDVAGTVALYGYEDFRSTTSTKRCLSVRYPSSGIRSTVKSDIGTNLSSVLVQGLTSGAIGYIYAYHNEVEFTYYPGLRLYLRQASGNFIAGEQIRVSVGSQSIGTLERKFDVEGKKSKNISSPSLGFARANTEQEREVLTLDQAALLGMDWNAENYPVGYFINQRYYYLYEYVCFPALAIAKEGALLNYYSDNTAVLNKVYSFLAFYQNSTYYVGSTAATNDIEETFLAHAGYYITNIFGTTALPSVVNVVPQVATSSTPTVTVSTTNFQISTTANPTSVSCISFVGVPGVSVSSSTSAVVTATSVSLEGQVGIASPRINASVTATSASIAGEANNVQNTLTVSYIPGKKVFVTMIFDAPEAPLEDGMARSSTAPQTYEEASKGVVVEEEEL